MVNVHLFSFPLLALPMALPSLSLTGSKRPTKDPALCILYWPLGGHVLLQNSLAPTP